MPKKFYFHNQREFDGIMWTAKVIDYGVSLTVISAINEVYSARCYLLDRRDLYRFSAKKYGNAASKFASNTEMTIKGNVISKSFWMDYSDKVIDEAEGDITKFRIAMKQVLDDAGVKESDLFSRTECARVLMDVSIKQYDGVIQDAIDKFGYNYGKYFSEFRLTDAYEQWNKMCDILYDGTAVDLNKESVVKAFEYMYDKFNNGKYIDSCLDEAIKNNPQFVKPSIAC